MLMHLCRATVNVLPLADMLIADVHNQPSALLQYFAGSWPVRLSTPDVNCSSLDKADKIGLGTIIVCCFLSVRLSY